jgi:hypothetical protein
MVAPLAYTIVLELGEAVTGPGQVPLILFGLATVTPEGRLSVRSEVRVSWLLLAFPRVKVSLVVPPGAILVGLNALASVGRLVTVRLPLPPTLSVPRSVTKAPGAIVLVELPDVLDVTVAVMVQLPLAGIVPPLAYVTVLPPAVPDFVPVQVPPMVAFDSVRPVGKLSTRLLVSVATELLLLLSVIVSVLVPPGAIVEGLKAFVSVGARIGGGLPLTVSTPLAPLVSVPRFVTKALGGIVLV